MRRARTALILTTATLAALLAGCSGAGGTDGGAANPTVTETVTVPPSDAASTPTPTPTPTCGPSSGAAAAAEGIAALPLPAGLEDAKWDAANADYSGYDACAPLSWSVVAPEFGTAGSPYAILLFHEGRYLGTATAQQYAFEPTVERRSDAAVTVTYRFAQAGEPNAAPSGRTTASFTWNDETGRVEMTGNTPPAQ